MKSLDPDFDEYVNRESFSKIRNQTELCGEALIEFKPIFLVTEIADRRSRMSRRTPNPLRKKRQTEASHVVNEWSSEVLKLKEVKRKKKVLELELSQLNNEI